MDSMDVCTATSTGDTKRCVDVKNGDRDKRLRLRKSAVQPPAMQSEDKRGPKTIAEESEQNTAWPSPNFPHETHSPRWTNDGGITFRLKCCKCPESVEFAPKDLVTHFEENHKGSQVVFPCPSCTFSTQDFSHLQIHLLSHKDTFSSCSICKDNVQRTWSEFSKHLMTHHCQNGRFSCETCQKFTTGDVTVFLDHIYVHNLCLEDDETVLPLHPKDFKSRTDVKAAIQSFQCQYCSYKSLQKCSVTKHIKAVHFGHKGNRRMTEVCPIAIKANDLIPKTRQRLTRSAVKEMCWLSQDCLSLPGRELLDKYCHLSDPQSTLEETQQFLMRSVSGETDEQKWTKALKTVLSNVPQDMNLYPKSENGVMCNSGFSDGTKDLTVLTVKNKITVSQNGAAYAKRLKMMASAEKEPLSAEGIISNISSVDEPKESGPDLNHTRPETRMQGSAPVAQQDNPVELTQKHENRENEELQDDSLCSEQNQKIEEPKTIISNEDGDNASNDVKLTKEMDNQMHIYKQRPKRKSKSMKWRRKKRSKVMEKKASAPDSSLAKNQLKDEQGVPENSASSSGRVSQGHQADPAVPQTSLAETTGLQSELQPEMQQDEWTKACGIDSQNPSKAIAPALLSKPAEHLVPDCTEIPAVSKNVDAKIALPVEELASMRGTEELLPLKVAVVDSSLSVGTISHSTSTAASVTGAEMCPVNMQLFTSDCHLSDRQADAVADDVTSCGSVAKSSSVSHPVIIPQGETEPGESSLLLSLAQTDPRDERTEESQVVANCCSYPSNNSPSGQSMQEEPVPPLHEWQPVPRDAERTLRLVALSPNQLVKRPMGDQPVVVLNHPDADIPEVSRIMQVVNRNQGEVQKVILSHRTLNALSVLSGETLKAGETSKGDESVLIQDNSSGPSHLKSSVQERFMLKLRLRRLSKKKYEVVGAGSPSWDPVMKFRCWFCGRVFACQETWMIHRQRHLMDWNGPVCENA